VISYVLTGSRERRRIVSIAALLLTLIAGMACRSSDRPDNANDVSVAAASDLKFALDEIVREFEARHSQIAVRITYGSSGNFYAQLRNQAPFDVFLSADVSYPRQLAAEGLTLVGSEFTYAFGRIVLWAGSSTNLDIERRRMEALRDPSVRHVAIANPAHAPYGRAAEAAMRSFGVYEAVKDKLVFGENIAQTFQFIESGAADAGIVALGLVGGPGMSKGRYWEVPADAYPRLEQGGAIMKWARSPEAARTFRSFVLGDTGREILQRYGFLLPGS
jgi:molybdate transport system substrate-binding protein